MRPTGKSFHGLQITGSIAVLALIGCVSAPNPAAEANASFSFIVIGDTPYDDDDIDMLRRAVSVIQETPPPFIIHVGDYKGGGAPCTDDHDARHASLVASLGPVPVFYTPGDNEWTDCDRFIDETTGKRYSDLARLERVRQMFFATPVDAPAGMDYERQPEQVENAAWMHGGVRFVTLHVTGTNNGRDWVTGDPLDAAADAAAAREAANARWLALQANKAAAEGAAALVIAMQADVTDVASKPEDVMCVDAAASDDHPCDAFTDLRRQIRDVARAFGKPVLAIHGDTAPFTLNQEFSGEDAPNLWRLNAAGDAGIGRTGSPYGLKDVTVVSIAPSADAPFAARGLLTEKTAKQR